MLNLNTVLSSLCDRGGSTDKIIMLNNSNTIIHRSQQQTKSSCSNKNRSGQTPRPTELTSPPSYVLLIRLIIKLLAIYLIRINTLL